MTLDPADIRWDKTCRVLLQKIYFIGYKWWFPSLCVVFEQQKEESPSSLLTKVISLSKHLHFSLIVTLCDLLSVARTCFLHFIQWTENIKFCSSWVLVMTYFLTGTQTSHSVWVVERKKRNRERWPAHLAWVALLLLRYYLWRGTEGCAAALHSSPHKRKNAHIWGDNSNI